MNNFLSQLFMISPRIILGVLLGITISKPIEMRIFNKEIEIQVEKQFLAEKEHLKKGSSEQIQIDQLGSEKNTLQQQYNTQRQDWLKAELDADNEAKGTDGTGLYGKGIVYDDKRNKADDLKKQMNDTQKKIDEISSKIDELQSQLNLQINKIQDKEQGKLTLVTQLEALHNLGKEREFIGLINHAISSLFILIELAPVLVKIMSPYGPYDAALAGTEETVIERHNLASQYRKKFYQEYFRNLEKISKSVLDETNTKIIRFINKKIDELLEALVKDARFNEVNEQLIKKIIKFIDQDVQELLEMIEINSSKSAQELQNIVDSYFNQKFNQKVHEQGIKSDVQNFENDLHNFEYSSNKNDNNHHNNN